MLKSKALLPGDWRVDSKGMLIPHSYLDWRFVERLFGTPIAFLAFLYQKKDLEISIDLESKTRIVQNASEKDLRKEVGVMAADIFQRNSLSRCTTEEKIAIARKIWGEHLTYSLSTLARVTMLDRILVESLFSKEEL
jgi:hypothetical protein